MSLPHAVFAPFHVPWHAVWVEIAQVVAPVAEFVVQHAPVVGHGNGEHAAALVSVPLCEAHSACVKSEQVTPAVFDDG